MRAAKAWTDEELADANDGSAACARDSRFWEVNPLSMNAIICEVQAWHRTYPEFTFSSGENVLVRRGSKRRDRTTET